MASMSTEPAYSIKGRADWGRGGGGGGGIGIYYCDCVSRSSQALQPEKNRKDWLPQAEQYILR